MRICDRLNFTDANSNNFQRSSPNFIPRTVSESLKDARGFYDLQLPDVATQWRIVSSVTSTEHSSFCVVTVLTQYLQYQATASYSVYKTLLIVVLLDPQKFTIVHLKPSLLWWLDYTSATCRLRQYTCCSTWTGQCQEKSAHSSSLLLQPSSASMAKACRDTVALHNRYNHCLYQLRF